ncbi:MAG: hypothetical protein AAGD04_00805 [Pseudomonadota bacterium]
MSRRDMLAWGATAAVAVPVFGIGGLVSVRAVQANIVEQDLSRLGTGTPSIVQVHDPGCALCGQLQRQTRRVLRAFDSDAYTYLVAHLTNPEGAAFASKYGAGRITLLLFDPKGRHVGSVVGPLESDVLNREIEAHLRRYRVLRSS